MAITEQQRFEMNLELRKHLGDDVANTLMEHLPPSGWSDVVRLKDFEALERRLDLRIDGLEEKVNSLKFSARFTLGLVVTFGIAISVMCIQLNFAIAGLK